MKVSIEKTGPVTRVRLQGRLDSKGMGSVYDSIVNLGSIEPGKVMVYLSEVEQATRAGTKALIVAAKLLHTRTGEKLLVHDASRDIAAILEGSGYDHLFDVKLRCEAQSDVAA
ncbi:MAG: hypothetical protein OXC60_02135 [Litoreibacter sp.]|nr:hypothetical protein [Litoreibacter sp.]